MSYCHEHALKLDARPEEIVICSSDSKVDTTNAVNSLVSGA